jgi:hypothetical protein
MRSSPAARHAAYVHTRNRSRCSDPDARLCTMSHATPAQSADPALHTIRYYRAERDITDTRTRRAWLLTSQPSPVLPLPALLTERSMLASASVPGAAQIVFGRGHLTVTWWL